MVGSLSGIWKMCIPILLLFSFVAWASGTHPGPQFPPLFLEGLNLLLQALDGKAAMRLGCWMFNTDSEGDSSIPSKSASVAITTRRDPHLLAKVLADLRDLHCPRKVSVSSHGHYGISCHLFLHLPLAWELSAPFPTHL